MNWIATDGGGAKYVENGPPFIWARIKRSRWRYQVYISIRERWNVWKPLPVSFPLTPEGLEAAKAYAEVMIKLESA